MKKIILTIIVLILAITNIILFRDYYIKNIEIKNNNTLEMIKWKYQQREDMLKSNDRFGSKRKWKFYFIKRHSNKARETAIADYYRKQGKMTEEEILKKCGLNNSSGCAHCQDIIDK